MWSGSLLAGYLVTSLNPFQCACGGAWGSIGTLSKGRADCHFMDKTPPGKEGCDEVTRESLISISGKEGRDEVTRESLISISYSLPDKVPASKLLSEKLKNENLVEGVDHDGAEKYRSELIAISYTQSPDIEGLPVSLD